MWVGEVGPNTALGVTVSDRKCSTLEKLLGFSADLVPGERITSWLWW